MLIKRDFSKILLQNDFWNFRMNFGNSSQDIKTFLCSNFLPDTFKRHFSNF